MSEIIFGLGANLCDPLKQIQCAVEYIKKDFLIKKVSSIYTSTSLLKDEQADYYNAVLLCDTNKNPYEILKITQSIESVMGRVKTKKWGERVIDIDVIDYNGIIFKDDNLVIPHYQLEKRSFVLLPLLEIKEDYIHPVLNKNIHEMINDLEDDYNIKIIKDKIITI